jgi:hypothetical protein
MSYLGISTFHIEGDWLLGYADLFVDEEGVPKDRIPDIRYNRRTHELQIHQDNDDEE